MKHCTQCEGSGYIFSGQGSRLDEDNYDICWTCDGYGYIEESEDLDPEL